MSIMKIAMLVVISIILAILFTAFREWLGRITMRRMEKYVQKELEKNEKDN